MFPDVQAIVEIKVGDDLVSTVYVTDLTKSPHWARIAENDRLIIDITDIHLLPWRGAKWDGSTFDKLTNHPPIPGYMYFAFVVDGECVYVDIQDPSDPLGAATIAAYKSAPSFEIHYA